MRVIDAAEGRVEASKVSVEEEGFAHETTTAWIRRWRERWLLTVEEEEGRLAFGGELVPSPPYLVLHPSDPKRAGELVEEGRLGGTKAWLRVDLDPLDATALDLLTAPGTGAIRRDLPLVAKRLSD